MRPDLDAPWTCVICGTFTEPPEVHLASASHLAMIELSHDLDARDFTLRERERRDET